jgi:large subunit ribosomal protein L32
MAVPKKRTSKTKKKMRRSHHGVHLVQLVLDPETGQAVMPHTTNPVTGKYKGREIINVTRKIERRQKKEASKS